MTKAKPYAIPKQIVWDAYKKVQSFRTRLGELLRSILQIGFNTHLAEPGTPPCVLGSSQVQTSA